MSEQVSRAEFNELKGQLDLVCQHLGLELGDFVVQGSGRRRAESVEIQDFSGFDQEESLDSHDEDSELAEDASEKKGWESINEEDDSEHTISYDPEEDDVFPGNDEEEVPFEDEKVAVQEVRHLPTTLNYTEPEKDEEEEDQTPLFADVEDENPYDETPVLKEENISGVTPDVLAGIFDVENVLTANDIASKQFTEIKKSLFTSPYNVDVVDEFLDEYLDVLQTREVSESKYAEALLKLDGRKFPESAEGYKKAEVDSFVQEISNELKRRIDIVA